MYQAFPACALSHISHFKWHNCSDAARMPEKTVLFQYSVIPRHSQKAFSYILLQKIPGYTDSVLALLFLSHSLEALYLVVYKLHERINLCRIGSLITIFNLEILTYTFFTLLLQYLFTISSRHGSRCPHELPSFYSETPLYHPIICYLKGK